jgi:hypothetical protein
MYGMLFDGKEIAFQGMMKFARLSGALKKASLKNSIMENQGVIRL